MVICGALGDLSRRKLLPAIYQLMTEHLVDPDFAVLGVGRDETQTDDDVPRADARGARRSRTRSSDVDDELWQELCKRLLLRVAPI